MKDEKLKELIRDGQEAERVINSPAYKKAYVLIKSDLLSKFESTRYDERNDRDEIWRKIQTLNWLEQEMQRIMRDGEVANKTLLQRIKDKFTAQ